LQPNECFDCWGGSLKPIEVPEEQTKPEQRIRVQYKVDDPENIIKDFEHFVREKYGFIRGAIGIELLKALHQYMADQGFKEYPSIENDENSITTTNLLPQHRATLRLLQKKYDDSSKIIFDDFCEAARQGAGVGDQRTHKRYADVFELNNILLRPGGVEKYDHYYFYTIPDKLPVEVPTLDKASRKVLEEFKGYHQLSINTLVRKTGLKEGKVIEGVSALEDRDMIETTAIGVFKITPYGEEACRW
jgi:hypothetical protein